MNVLRPALLAAAAIAVGASGTAHAAPAVTPVGGSTGCLTPVKTKGCTQLRTGLKGKDVKFTGGWEQSADGRTVVGVVGEDALVALRRHPGTQGLQQLGHAAGCLTPTGKLGCRKDARIGGVISTTLSPDGKLVATVGYAPNSDGVTLTIVRRDPQNGGLLGIAKDGCLTQGRRAGCKTVPSLGRSVGPLIWGADGKDLYLASYAAVVSLRVSAAGVPSAPTSCFAAKPEYGGAPAGCTVVPGLNADAGTAELLLSDDGKTLYARSNGRMNPGTGDGSTGHLAIFARDTTTGALSALPGKAGCVVPGDGGSDCQGVPGPYFFNALTVSGDAILLAGPDEPLSSPGRVQGLRRGADGMLTPTTSTPFNETGNGGASVVRTGDVLTYFAPYYDLEARVYGGFVRALRLDQAGAAAQPIEGGCIASEAPTGSPCSVVSPLDNVSSLAIAPGGKSAVVLSTNSARLLVLDRDPATGVLKRSSVTKTASVEGTLKYTPSGKTLTVLGNRLLSFRVRG